MVGKRISLEKIKPKLEEAPTMPKPRALATAIKAMIKMFLFCLNDDPLLYF